MIEEVTIDFIENMEKEMDDFNGEHGTQDSLCCYCGSDVYDGFSGIIHKTDCLIKNLRDWLFLNRDISQKGTKTNTECLE